MGAFDSNVEVRTVALQLPWLLDGLISLLLLTELKLIF